MSGTHSERERRWKPPAYGFQAPRELDGGHEAIRRALAASTFPQPIAARFLHRLGTLTNKGGLPAWTTRPDLLQYGQRPSPDATV
jgi:hypothetical protein